MEQNGLIRQLVVGDQVLVKEIIDLEGYESDEELEELETILGRWATISYVGPEAELSPQAYCYILRGIPAFGFAIKDFEIKETNFSLIQKSLSRKVQPRLPNI